MPGHVEQRRVIADLALLVLAEHRGLHPVVEHLARHPAQFTECLEVTAHHAVKVLTAHEARVHIAAVAQHHGEQPHRLDPLRFLGEHHLELREVHLRLMPCRGLEAVLESHGHPWAHRRHVVRHRGTTAAVAQLSDLAKQAHRGELRIPRQALAKILPVRVDHPRPRRARSVLRAFQPTLQILAHRLAVQTATPRDRGDRFPLLSELMNHE